MTLSTWQQVASVISQSTDQPVVMELAVGVVNRVSLSGSVGEAQIKFGFSPDLIPVPASNWGDPFVSEVQAGSVSGRRVLVGFADRQPIIFFTLGV